jgi:two-component system sensor histidine kinase BaeS
MRRRLTIAIVGSVVAALLLAGLGTLALAELGARRYAEGELRRQVDAITSAFEATPGPFRDSADRPRLLGVLRLALRLEGVGLLALEPDGAVRGAPPPGITLEPDELAALRAGETVSGRSGRLVYAATTVGQGDNLTAIVLSDRTDIALGGSVVWFLVAAGIVVLIGAVVASRLAATLTGPLRRAEEAGRAIAGGDLSARVPEPPPGATDEVAALARSLNGMAGALERSRGLEQQFLLSVSHDLRTPLTSIQGYAEALVDGAAEDAPRAGAVILGEARRLDRLVRDLLQLARLDGGAFDLTMAEVELHELVAACAEGVAPEAQAAGVDLRVDAAPVVVVGDPDRLAQVVANLLDNALKHARHQVLVTVSPHDGGARVTVDDDGPGISPTDLPHVFERLYVARQQPLRREIGSGLGLAIVRELVHAMGGTVGADTAPTGGARLWFHLPATR